MKHVGRVSKTLPARAQQFDWKAALATPIQTPPLGYANWVTSPWAPISNRCGNL